MQMADQVPNGFGDFECPVAHRGLYLPSRSSTV
jgi:hypothetical protein